MDKETLGDTVHNVNMLTVIASESYKDFVSDLQSDIKKELYDRPSKATIEYFEGKTIMIGDEPVVPYVQQLLQASHLHLLLTVLTFQSHDKSLLHVLCHALYHYC